MRLSGAVFYYEIKDQQLSAIGGGANLVQLVNADKGTGKGFEIEGDFLPTDNLEFTLGYSYVDTELKDDTLDGAAVRFGAVHRDRSARCATATPSSMAIRSRRHRSTSPM